MIRALSELDGRYVLVCEAGRDAPDLCLHSL